MIDPVQAAEFAACFLCGMGAMDAGGRLLRLAFQMKRELQQDLITRLTDRHYSIVAAKRNGVLTWKVYGYSENLMQAPLLGQSKHWQRAAQMALDGTGPDVPAPGCQNCAGKADAIANEPYTSCQTCGRMLHYMPVFAIAPPPPIPEDDEA